MSVTIPPAGSVPRADAVAGERYGRAVAKASKGGLYCVWSRRPERDGAVAYLVRRLEGSTVVAVIQPIGVMPRAVTASQLRVFGALRSLAVTGARRTTASGRFSAVPVGVARATRERAPD